MADTTVNANSSSSVSEHPISMSSTTPSILDIFKDYCTIIRKKTNKKTSIEKEKEPLYKTQLISALEEHILCIAKSEETSEQLQEKDEIISNLNIQIEELNAKIVVLEEQVKQLNNNLADESGIIFLHSGKQQDEGSTDSDSSREAEKPKNKLLSKSKSSGPPGTSTPKFPKFQEDGAKRMSIGELADNFIKTVNAKVKNSAAEAKKFQNALIRRIQVEERRIEENNKKLEEAKETIMKLKQDIEVLTKTSKTLEQQMHNNYNTMNQVIHDKQQKIEELERERTVQPQQNNQNYETIEAMGETINKYDMELKTYAQKISELEKILKDKEELLKQLIQNNNNEVTSTNIQIIMETLFGIRREIRENMTVKQKTFEKIQHVEEVLTVQPTYSEKAATTPPIMGEKQHQIYSKAAILIKRINNSNMSLNDIATILTRETKEKTLTREILCEPARDRNTLIIKTTTDEKTHNLLKTIESIVSLKDVIEITYKAANLKRIIVLGIPNEILKEDIIQTLNEKYRCELPINSHRFFKRKNSKTYQLVLETEDWIARRLLQKQKLHLGFNSCKILPYMPIVRCENCQRYGHTGQNCRQQTRCQFCAGGHATAKCGVTDNENKHRCINCMGTGNTFPHHAGSSDCPCYQFHIQKRNTLANKLIQIQ